MQFSFARRSLIPALKYFMSGNFHWQRSESSKYLRRYVTLSSSSVSNSLWDPPYKTIQEVVIFLNTTDQLNLTLIFAIQTIIKYGNLQS